MKVSVAIVTRNRSASLKNCLGFLVKQTTKPYEVLVIDNGSTDTTKDIVFSFLNKLPLNYIYEETIGIPFARNTAIHRAKGDIIAFIDDDCLAEKNWIKNIKKSHKKNPFAGAIQGKSLAIGKHAAIARLSEIFHKRYIESNLLKDKKLLIIDTKNVSFKLTILRDKHIFFDTQFLRAQDVDIAKQLLDRQIIIYYDPSIRIRFFARPTLFSFLKQRYYIGRFTTKLKCKWAYSFVSWGNQMPKTEYPRGITLAIYRFFADYAFRVGEIQELLSFFYNVKRLDGALHKENLLFNHKKQNLSVIIITKDHYESLATCLRSITKQTQIPYEVIIVDATKKNNKYKEIEKEFKSVCNIIYIHAKQTGYASQRNLGIDKASGDIIAMVSDDAVVDTKWSEMIIRAHMNFPQSAAIQGRIVSTPVSSVIAQLHQVRMDLWFLRNLDLQNKIAIIATKNVSFKRKIFDMYPLRFLEDPVYDKYGGEDVDMGYCIRWILRQYILYDPTIRVYHKETSSIKFLCKDRFAKGSAQGLLVTMWPEIVKIFPLQRRIPHVLQIIFRFVFIISHPIFRNQRYKSIFVLLLRVLATRYYLKGMRTMFLTLKRSPVAFVIPKRWGLINRSTQITVGIITRDRQAYLRKLLASLTHQTILPNKILIVDTGSEDITQDVVRLYSKILPIDYFFNKSSSIAENRNILLKHTKTKYLTFVDDDCIVPPLWIENILHAHSIHPDAIAIQGQSISIPFTSIYSFIKQYERHNWIFCNMEISWRKYWNIILGKSSGIYTIKTIDTRNVSLVFSRIKPLGIMFDPLLQRGSDTDFGKKLIQHGQRIVFSPQLSVFHYERQTFFAFMKQNFQRGFGWFLLTQRYKKDYTHVFSFFSSVQSFWTACKKDKIPFFTRIKFSFIFSLYLVITEIGYSMAMVFSKKRYGLLRG